MKVIKHKIKNGDYLDTNGDNFILIGSDTVLSNHPSTEANSLEQAATFFSLTKAPTAPGQLKSSFGPPTAKIPNISPAQLRLALFKQKGVTENQIVAMIEAIPDKAAMEEAKIRWEYSTEIRREHPLIAAFGAKLGMNEQELNEFFLYARTL